MSDAVPTKPGGAPIVAHLALLVAIALAAAYIVNIAAVLMLPPRPPDVMRGDKVLEAFERGFETAKAGRTPASGQGARWAIENERPRITQGSRPARFVARDLARRLSLPREKVLVSFNPTPTDVVVFRVRNEELRAEHMEQMHERRGAMRIDTEALRALHARRMKAESAGDVAAVRAIDEELRSEVAKIREARARLRMGMEHGPGEHVRVETRRSDDGETVVVTRENVAPSAPAPPARVAAAPAPPEPPEPPRFAPPPPGVVLMSRFLVAAELGDGRWLVMRQQSNAETADWIMRAALGIGATLVVLLLLALLFARRLAAPIQRFAEAARRVGIDPGEASVKEEGPAELRTAARAVNAMQARLRALVAERTEMLAAVAHDLRTPLMRLRLAAENADPAIRDKLAKETGEIDAMVSSFIAFARDDPTREARVKLDLAALIQSIVDDRAEAREDVTFEGPDRLVVTGQPVGLKRLVENLIDNAVKYGGVARVVVHQDGAEACIEVSDEGPGIPKAERERVFRPFVRGEGAPGAGAGLGLAAAREIARAHGGDVEIADTQPRGALVRVTLPV